jgi:hypothetical protein
MNGHADAALVLWIILDIHKLRGYGGGLGHFLFQQVSFQS